MITHQLSYLYSLTEDDKEERAEDEGADDEGADNKEARCDEARRRRVSVVDSCDVYVTQ